MEPSTDETEINPFTKSESTVFAENKSFAKIRSEYIEKRCNELFSPHRKTLEYNLALGKKVFEFAPDNKFVWTDEEIELFQNWFNKNVGLESETSTISFELRSIGWGKNSVFIIAKSTNDRKSPDLLEKNKSNACDTCLNVSIQMLIVICMFMSVALLSIIAPTAAGVVMSIIILAIILTIIRISRRNNRHKQK